MNTSLQTTAIIEIPLSKIKLDKNQPRKEFDEEKLKEMAESVKVHGTLQPIEIDETYTIIFGEMRYRSAILAGRKTIPCKIVKGITPHQRLERQLVENFSRQDMKITDNIAAIQKLLKHPPAEWNVSRETSKSKLYDILSKRLGVSSTWIESLVRIDTEAPEELKKGIFEDKISVSQASEIMKIPDKSGRIKLAKLILRQKEVPEYRKIRNIVLALKDSPEDVRDAIYDGLINADQAQRISKLEGKAREKAIKQHSVIKLVEKNIEDHLENEVEANNQKEFDKRILQANNWLASLKGSVTDSRSQLEKTFKILAISARFLPAMDEKQKAKLNQELDRFLETLEKSVQLADKIKGYTQND